VITKTQAAADETLDLGLTPREARSYSFGRAILSACNPKESTLEREVHNVIAARLGREIRGGAGIFIPTRLNPQASGLDTKTNAGGGYTVATDVHDYVDMLRQQMRVAQLGATVLTGLRFNVQIPTESTATSVSWIGGDNPGVDVAEVDPTFGSVLGAPRTTQSTTAASKQLLKQCAGNIDLETRLRKDIARSHAIAFDAAAINGSGASGQPTGLLQTTGISIVPLGQNGAVPTYSNICDLEAAPANANVDDNSIGFLSTPNIKKLLRRTFVNGVGSRAVWGDDGLLGHTSLVSTNCPSNLSKGTANGTLSAIVSGVWSELLLCEFGVLEVLTDPWRLKKQGLVELTSFSMCDVVLPRPAAFAAIVDAALS